MGIEMRNVVPEISERGKVAAKRETGWDGEREGKVV